MSYFGMELSLAQEGVNSPLGEFASVVGLTAPPDKIPATSQIKLTSRQRLGQPQSSWLPICGSSERSSSDQVVSPMWCRSNNGRRGHRVDNPEFVRPLLTRVEDSLEVRQERVDVDVGQFLRRVGLVRRFKRAVGKGGVQFADQFIYVRRCPRGARLPQAADHRSALVPVRNRFDHVGLRRLDERHDLHLAGFRPSAESRWEMKVGSKASRVGSISNRRCDREAEIAFGLRKTSTRGRTPLAFSVSMRGLVTTAMAELTQLAGS